MFRLKKRRSVHAGPEERQDVATGQGRQGRRLLPVPKSPEG